ncbi:MAG: homoaconitate hydratase [Anaerolineae bacterium]|nr:homoaconitate hydratase [Anaerolineae bacterium]
MARVWKFGDDVDTDQIVPGRYSPYMTSEAELPGFAFIEFRPEFSREVRPGDVIVAGDNFGCGSSREYAPLALKKCGIAGIIANSFARIFFRNAINLGIPLFEDQEAVRQLQDGDQVELDAAGGQITVDGRRITLRQPPRFVQDILAAGTIADYIREHGRFPGE